MIEKVWKKLFAFVVAGLLAVILASGECAAQASFQGLGDLPGGTFESRAYGVSADGNTVVGYSDSGSAEAFRWTAASGIHGLGFLPVSISANGHRHR
jgi:probable HAF family extracellular repeat protein